MNEWNNRRGGIVGGIDQGTHLKTLKLLSLASLLPIDDDPAAHGN